MSSQYPSNKKAWIFMPMELAPGMTSEPKSLASGKCLVSSSIIALVLKT